MSEGKALPRRRLGRLGFEVTALGVTPAQPVTFGAIQSKYRPRR